MTLDTSLIERESRELYMRFIKDPRIPDDLCSEIYMEFVEKINKEKASGIKRIDRGGIGQLIRLAVQTIFHKNKKQLEKDSVLNGIVGRDASRLWCINKSEKEREFFAKIALFLKDWVKRKKNYPDYLYVFMLYHSFHLSPDFIDELGPLTGRDGKKLQAELDDLKEKIRIRVGDKLEKKLQILGAQYYLLVKKQHLPGGLFIEEYNCSQRDYRESKK